MATRKHKKSIPANSGGTRDKVGKGKPPLHTRFSSTNQPNKENQLKAVREHHVTRAMINEIFKMPYRWSKSTENIRREIESTFGSDLAHNSNVFTIMVAVQVIKAINKKDTIAFEKLSNQCWGLPVLSVDAPHKLIVEVVHDNEEILNGLNNGLHPVS